MVITYSSMKGGVGKTTNAILTATNLATRGFKVLFTNNSGTMYFTQGIEGIIDTIETHNVFESLSHNDIEKYGIHSRIENIDIVPSHLNIFKLRGIGYNEFQKTLRGYEEKYDYVVIDTAMRSKQSFERESLKTLLKRFAPAGGVAPYLRQPCHQRNPCFRHHPYTA